MKKQPLSEREKESRLAQHLAKLRNARQTRFEELEERFGWLLDLMSNADLLDLAETVGQRHTLAHFGRDRVMNIMRPMLLEAYAEECADD